MGGLGIAILMGAAFVTHLRVKTRRSDVAQSDIAGFLNGNRFD